MKLVLHYKGDMKKVTITLDEEVARWARINNHKVFLWHSRLRLCIKLPVEAD